MTHLPNRRLSALTLVAAIAALCLAACGSSSNTSSASSSGSAAASTTSGASGSAGSPAARTKLATCLKSHGVTLPSRPAGARRQPPNGGGGGAFFGGGGKAGGGRFANNPKLRAAFQACGGGRGFGGGRRFTISHTAINKFVACVKQHGYNLPAPNFSGKGPVFPASIEKNKKFQTASKSCTSVLRPAGGPGGGAPAGGSATTSGT